MSEPALRRRPDRNEDHVQRTRLRAFMGMVVVVLMAIVLALGIITDSTTTKSGVQLTKWWWIPVSATVLFFGMIVAVDALTPRRKLSTILSILFGVFGGLITTLLLGIVVDYLISAFQLQITAQQMLMIKVIMGLGLCYLGAATVLQTQDDFRVVIPYVEFAKQLRGAKPLIMDTSALIDGRIADIADTGLIQTPLVIPGFVIGELQTLGDSGDKLKRARGRRGLEMVAKLQRSPRLDVTIDETAITGKEVDAMIVELARLMPGTIVTTDMGLNRVASIQGVSVLNINDLANAMKPNVIPGEPLSVNVLTRGEQADQGVGYLEDGTMVIVENGEPYIGREVMAVVKKTMQTSAGRLIFCRIEDEDAPGADAHDDESVETDESPATFRDPMIPRAPRPRTHRNPRRT